MSARIFWAGDSTVKRNDFRTYPQTGIGQALRLFLKEDVMIFNHAENGRSSKSFIDESRLAPIYNGLRQGDFLFIQFGHNDGKTGDINRYTEPYGTFQEHLERYVNAARNKKAFPVLITPVCRRWFESDGKLMKDIHGDYPEAMIELADRLEVPLIDLYTSSQTLIQKWGIHESENYFVSWDNTHLTYQGAFAFAGLLSDGIRQLGGVYKVLLLDKGDEEAKNEQGTFMAIG